jgi:hypothetical protein
VRAHLQSLLGHGDPAGAAGVDVEFDRWEPPNVESFLTFWTAYIASSDDGVPDAFDFTVCTPDQLPVLWRQERDEIQEFGSPGEHEFISLHGVFVMERWDARTVRSRVERLCDDARGPDWNLVAAQLSSQLRWEFDYRLDPDWKEKLGNR